MPRSAASIQLEIDMLESYLPSEDSLTASGGADGVNFSRANREALQRQLNKLYQQLDRATGASPMFVRGRVKGLGDA